MDKKITFFAKLGLILIALGSVLKIFNYPGGWESIVCSTIVILPIFFVLNLIKELKEEKEYFKISVFLYFLGAISFLFGLGFKTLGYNFGVNFFLISIVLFSLFLLINDFKNIKERKKNIFPFIIYPLVLFFVVVSLKFYFLPDSFQNSPIHFFIFLVLIFALISFVILLVNSIKKAELNFSKSSQLKLSVLLVTFMFFLLIRINKSIPHSTQVVNEIKLLQIQEENEYQVVLGNSLITDKNKILINKLDNETQKVINQLDSIKFFLLSLNDKQFHRKMKDGQIKSSDNTGEKLMPFSIKISDIINPYNTIELSRYNYPYEIVTEYRKSLLTILFPKLNVLHDYAYNSEYFDNAIDLKSKIIRISKSYNLTEDEQKLLLLIVMKDTHHECLDYNNSNYYYKMWNFEFLTIASAIEIITKLQNEILSTRTLIISHV